MSALAATLHVYTFKRGLLSAVGHDLRLSFRRFGGRWQHGRLTVDVDAGSLVADGAIDRSGRGPEPLSRIYTDEIERNALGPKVLDAARHPRARFEGRVDLATGTVEGTLALRGTEAPVRGTVATTDEGARAVFEIVPSRFGIRPFRAMAGALKLEDRVRIEAAVAWPEGPPPSEATFHGPAGPA